MKKINIILFYLAVAITVAAQDEGTTIVKQGKDSTINQNVTLERDFQPVIQDAGKINISPKIYEPQPADKDVRYTGFSKLLDTDANLNQLTFADSRFKTITQSYKGFLRAQLGFPMTGLDFYYKMNESDKVNFDVHLDHLGQWDSFTKHGAGILANTGFGFDVDALIGSAAFNIGFDARNLTSKRYFTGVYWDFDAHVGIHSTSSSPVEYIVQVGYLGTSAKNKNFASIPNFVDMNPSIMDNQIQTIAKVAWATDAHHIGLDAQIKDHFFSTSDTTFEAHNFHAMHFEPYYEYEGNRFNIHAGVNLDVSINKGRKFAASPNVHFEARIVPEWLAIYGGAVGHYAINGLHDEIYANNYSNLINACYNQQNTYNVADGFLGLKFRPHHDLLFKVYAHYIYSLDDSYYLADSTTQQFYNVTADKSSEWRIGGAMHYHYRDIATLDLDGFYSLFKFIDGPDIAYDRPAWQMQLDLRVKLDKKKRWTLISDNYLKGKRQVLVLQDADPSSPISTTTPETDPDAVFLNKTLKPYIDLNLGVSYAIDRNLAVNLQLNDYIHWGKFKNELWYGYTTQGGNILVGVNWTF